MIFSDKVSRLCEARGWNQTDLARAAGVSKNTASRWWNGVVKPFDDAALKVARALGVTLDYLADDAVDEPPAPELTQDERLVLSHYRVLKLSRGMEPIQAMLSMEVGFPSPDQLAVADVFKPVPAAEAGRQRKPARAPLGRQAPSPAEADDDDAGSRRASQARRVDPETGKVVPHGEKGKGKKTG